MGILTRIAPAALGKSRCSRLLPAFILSGTFSNPFFLSVFLYVFLSFFLSVCEHVCVYCLINSFHYKAIKRIFVHSSRVCKPHKGAVRHLHQVGRQGIGNPPVQAARPGKRPGIGQLHAIPAVLNMRDGPVQVQAKSDRV